MGYNDEINKLFDEVAISAQYYVKIRSLLGLIYTRQYGGSDNMIANMDLLLSIRDRKISEGRSTKSMLSATDSQVYLFNDVWKRLARKEHNSETLDRARFLLNHFTRRTDNKSGKAAEQEYKIIEQLRTAVEQENLTMEMLGSPKIEVFLEDINPYKNLEGYLKDADILESKPRSKWRQELPLLLVVLGIDPKLFESFFANESPFRKAQSEDTDEHHGNDNNQTNTTFYQYLNDLPNWLKTLLLVAITASTIYVLSQRESITKAGPKHRVPEKAKLSLVETPINSSEILSAFLPISRRLASTNALLIQVKKIHSRQVLDTGNEFPLLEMSLEIAIQNLTDSNGYVFEGMKVTTLQNISVSGDTLNIDVPNTSSKPKELILDCKKDAVRYWTISNDLNRTLTPGLETVCSLKFSVENSCYENIDGYRLIPFKITFDLQNVNGKDLSYEMVEVFELGIY